MRRLLSVIVCCTALTAASSAATLFEHLSSTVPATEGWIDYTGYGGQCTVGPLIGDLGYDAWFAADNSAAGGTYRNYYQVPTATQLTDAHTLGWKLSVRMRPASPAPDTSSGSVAAWFSEGTNRWILDFGSAAGDSPMVTAVTGSPTVWDGFDYAATSGGYHLYEAVYDPAAQSADVFVDGVERISNWHGDGYSAAAGVVWGSGSSPDSGQGNWNLVRFEILPEPASLMLLLALASLAGSRRR